MITVKYKKDNKKYISISIFGHANYDEYGKDIVCSAVSSIVTTTINSVLSLNSDGLKFKSNDGNVDIYNISNDINTNKLLDVLINMLNELEKDYPLNIKISKED